ncbi:CD151 antigen-like [Porites lutea]|uniref:CD151 antigen-like n=1 Tax=Porites lutea TaxID=51062 RepID=UPI003CC6888A
MASGGMVLIKYLLFFFNFIFWLSGLALIVVGAVIKAKYGDFVEITTSSLTTGPVFLIIIGVIVAIVGFLGCCGAYKENYCMVTTFAILLVIIFILEIAAGALAYAFKDKLEGYVKEGLEKGVDKYATDKVIQKAMDKAQKEFACCGVDNYTDYFKAGNGTVFPESCCKKGVTGCPTTVSDAKKNPSKLNSKGCLSELEKYLKDHIVVVGGVGIGIAFIQLIGIIFACCLMRSIKKEYEVM